MVQASHNGTRVYCVNHFYPIAEQQNQIQFGDNVEAIATVYQSQGGFRVNYQVTGNSKNYDTYCPPYCDQTDTDIPGYEASFHPIQSYPLGNGIHIALVEILPHKTKRQLVVYDQDSYHFAKNTYIRGQVPRALSNIQQKALEAFLALEPTEDTLASLTKQDSKNVTVALNWLRSYGSDRSTDLRADRTCDLIYWAIVAK